MFNIDIITLIAFLGAFQGLAFAAIFWLKNKNISNKVFSLLLLATSIRIAKNIFVHLRELNPDMFTWIEFWRTSVYIGLTHQFAIGPLFYLYYLSKLQQKFKWRATYLWHFLPYGLLLVISPFLQWSFWANGGLWFSYLSILFYYLLTFRVFYKEKEPIDRATSNWLKSLLLVAFLLMLAYSPALFKYLGYIGGAFLYTIAILTIGYIMLTNKGSIAFFRTKYETSSLSSRTAKEIRKRLEIYMQTQQPFIDPELTLQTLAQQLSVHPHHLSRVINQELKMSFTDYINSFRLEVSAKRLRDPNFDHLKISALAYESGFNSVPTFNTLFKKVYKMTPSEYRNR
ncbi:MAG: hypothetical protein DHS20C18_06070 [Saprospiraceae bacterium]|nr:MAG: hypothetical protein DHS20C18_06070 [Saprospiraceae bacterium]